jgi:hypothetical protein
MDKKFFLGLLVGVVGLLVFQKIMKKPCACKDTNQVDETLEVATTMGANLGSTKKGILPDQSMDMSCQEAADMVVRKIMSVARYSSKEAYDEAYNKLYETELQKCLKS